MLSAPAAPPGGGERRPLVPELLNGIASLPEELLLRVRGAAEEGVMRDDDSDDDASGGNEEEEEDGEEEGGSGSDEEAWEADGQEGVASRAWDMPEAQGTEGVRQEGSTFQHPGLPGPAGPPFPSGSSDAESRRVVPPAGGDHPQGFLQGVQQSTGRVQQEPLREPGGWGTASPGVQRGEAVQGYSSSSSGVRRGGGAATSGGRPATSGGIGMVSGISSQSRHVQFQGVCSGEGATAGAAGLPLPPPLLTTS